MAQKAPTSSAALTVRDLLDVLNRLPRGSHGVHVVIWEESGNCYRPVCLVRLCQIDGTREIQVHARLNPSEAAIGLF